MKIYRLTDRIPLSIKSGNEVVWFQVRPLAFSEKAEIASLSAIEHGIERKNKLEAVKLALRYCLKGCKGIKNSDDTEYNIEFFPDGSLTDDCAEDLLNTDISPGLIMAAFSLINGVSSKVIDPSTGKEIEGIEFHLGDVKSVGKP